MALRIRVGVKPEMQMGAIDLIAQIHKSRRSNCGGDLIAEITLILSRKIDYEERNGTLATQRGHSR